MMNKAIVQHTIGALVITGLFGLVFQAAGFVAPYVIAAFCAGFAFYFREVAQEQIVIAKDRGVNRSDVPLAGLAFWRWSKSQILEWFIPSIIALGAGGIVTTLIQI